MTSSRATSRDDSLQRADERDPVAWLRDEVVAAAVELADERLSAERVTFERPPKPDFGDYSTNAGMLIAPALGGEPRAAAERLGEAVRERLAGQLARVEVAGPGFLNLFLADGWYARALAGICAAGERFGTGAAEPAELVNVEFVSANPTGPLHIGHGRHAAYGDSLARTLELAGHRVRREFYVNDAGSQARLFGESLAARIAGQRGEPAKIPEGGYQGEYVAETAAKLVAEGSLQQGPGAGDSAGMGGTAGINIDELARRGMDVQLAEIRETLTRFRVGLDVWSSERELHESGGVEQALAALEESGHTYESEGALWLRTTEFGDDKDRVLRRSNGELTYFAADIAYHDTKRRAGERPDRLIDVLGADHHGYVGRMKAAFAALGDDPERLEIIIMQLVNVIERGERAQMSKRRGEFEALDDLIDDIGADAARFFLLQRSHDTAIDLDLELARQESPQNPVYYVQYAHARIASILRNAGDDKVTLARELAAAPAGGSGSTEGPDAAATSGAAAGPSPTAQLHPSERTLIRTLLDFPGVVEVAARQRAPHRFATYTLDLASDFTAFYRDCKVLDAEPAATEQFRLALCLATQDVIRRGLDLLGVSAPERM